MEPIAYWLPVVWAALLGVGVVMYVLLDGFDLGIGILFLTGAGEEERDQMMNSIAPYWDGNETWLVLGGAGLLVAFPLAYGIIMPALYLPLVGMLLALVFRGVAFEFRFVSKPHNRWWDRAFAAGSTVATFCQGLVLGGFLQDIPVADRQFSGGSFYWATPFSFLCGFGLISGYALLGSGWLMMKTEGAAGRPRAESCPGGARPHALFYRRGEPLDAAGVPAYRGSLVRRQPRALFVAHSAGDRCRCVDLSGPASARPPACRPSYPRWRCSCCAFWGLAFRRSPISCRPPSRFGTPPPFPNRRSSASLAPCFSCRWSWPTPPSSIGPSAARSPRVEAIISARAAALLSALQAKLARIRRLSHPVLDFTPAHFR